MSYIPSPNMLLPVPGVGTQPGPQYASNVNSSLTLIDSHDHSLGKGVQITPSGLNINSDLSILSNSLINVKSVSFTDQSAALSSSLIGRIYSVLGNLYFNDGLGNQIPITANGAVAGTPGSIANLVSPASASYVSLSSTFVWQSDVNTAANMDLGSLILRNAGASSFGLTLSAPSLAADASITLPPAPAVSASPVIMSTAGVMSTGAPQDYRMPAGMISAYGGPSAPSGWLICDGSAVDRSTYSALFSAIGTAYGYGNNSTTFNVPDFRGQFLRGVSGSSGRDPNASGRTAMNPGGATGNTVGSVQPDDFASHTHTISDPGHSHTIGSDVTNTATPNVMTKTGTNRLVNGSTDTSTTGISNQYSGGSETRPTNAYVNFIIKT